MTEKLEFFCDNIIFERYLTKGNAKVLKNQNLQLKYSFDFSNYIDTYLYLCNLGRQFCKITHTSFRNFNTQIEEMCSQRLMDIYDCILLICISISDTCHDFS